MFISSTIISERCYCTFANEHLRDVIKEHEIKSEINTRLPSAASKWDDNKEFGSVGFHLIKKRIAYPSEDQSEASEMQNQQSISEAELVMTSTTPIRTTSNVDYSEYFLSYTCLNMN